jgi:hypothetical protein
MAENELVGELLQKMADEFYKGNYIRCFADLENYARFHEGLVDKFVPKEMARDEFVGRNIKTGKKWTWHVVERDQFEKVFPDMFSLICDFYAYKKADAKLPYVKYPLLPIQFSGQVSRIINREKRIMEPLEKKLERYSKLDGLPMPKRIAYDYLFRKTLRKIGIDCIINDEIEKLNDLLKKYNLEKRSDSG